MGIDIFGFGNRRVVVVLLSRAEVGTGFARRTNRQVERGFRRRFVGDFSTRENRDEDVGGRRADGWRRAAVD